MSQVINDTNRFSLFWSLIKRSLKGENYDYTQGNIKHAIVLLAIPMILELSLESVFAVVDMFFVGKLGKEAVQTVGLTESVMTLVYTIAIGLSTGTTAIVARRTGEKNPEAAAQAGMQALIISIMLAIVITILGMVYAPEILRIMGAEEETIRQGTGFTRVMFGGSLVIILLFLINGIFRGAGNAAIAMRSLWLASLVNIILCPIFIHFWGLTGAAIATTVGRGMGVLYQCYFLFRGQGVIRMKASYFRFDFPLMKSLVNLSAPATVQFFFASGSWIFLTMLVAHTGGDTASAGYQIAIRNIGFFILPAWGLSNAAATLVGQNLGAGQVERAQKSVFLTARYNAIFMAGVTLFFLLFARPVIGVFTKDPEVLNTGVMALQIISAGYIFYGIGMVMIQALNGAGDTRTPTVINFFGFWIFQIPFAYALSQWLGMGATGSFVAIPVAETLIAITAWIYFRKGKWKTIKV